MLGLETTCAEIMTRVKRHYQTAELVGEDNNIAEAIAELEALIVELRVLQTHEHQWDSEDYCYICGSDGRA
jgi:hypothetical protein